MFLYYLFTKRFTFFFSADRFKLFIVKLLLHFVAVAFKSVLGVSLASLVQINLIQLIQLSFILYIIEL